MPISITLFALLLVLCLSLSIREWRRYRAGNTTQFAFIAQVVCVILCIFAVLSIADENMRRTQAERVIGESVTHLRAGNMPDLDPTIHLMQKDIVTQYKGHAFPESYTVNFLGSIRDFAIADVDFSNGEKLTVHLRDTRQGPRWWPPFFAMPAFKVSLMILVTEDQKPPAPQDS